MKIIGYARVSTTQQRLDSQIDSLKAYGVDKLYTEKESGTVQNRAVLNEALQELKAGDVFVIYKLDRLARGTAHLLQLLEFFDEKGVQFVSLQNQLDTGTPTGKLLFTIMGAFAEMEASLIRERVLDGLESARKRGVQLGRPPKSEQISKAIHLYETSELTISEIAKNCDISRTLIYKQLSLKGIPLHKKVSL